MLKSNSPTVQSMIETVKAGNTDQAGLMNSTQFQSPYPSPKDMVMNMGYPGMVNYGYQVPPTVSMYGMNSLYPNQAQYPSMTGPAIQTFREVPGAPVNPDLAHLTGQSFIQQPQQAPGRFMDVQNQTPLYGRNYVGQLNNQSNPTMSFYMPPKPTLSMDAYYNRPQHYGEINMYNGEAVHPGVFGGWYGSGSHPFQRQSEYQNNLRNKFAEKFPGYYNPYAVNNGFMTPIELQSNIDPEVRYTANLAAYYGMSYEDFIGNSSIMYKKLCGVVNKYFDGNEQSLIKREKAFELKKPGTPGKEPDNDTDLFYPMGAFDASGHLTHHYLSLFCVNHDRIKKVKAMKVKVTIGDQVIECKHRNINYLTSTEKIEKAINEGAKYDYWLQFNRYRAAQYYWQAPERQLDNLEGNVFEITTKALNFAEQKELENQWSLQRSTRSAYSFNREDFLTDIKNLFNKSRARHAAIEQKKFDNLIKMVSHNNPAPQIGNCDVTKYSDRPYIEDGDWVIAKPGVDIVGLPLEQSVNKIIKMNLVTGEEEIYDPNKMMGLDVRERIKESMEKTPFTEIEGDELEKRLSRFSSAEFADF